MSRTAPNYIWEKLATATWLKAHDIALQEATGGTHAVVENPNRARLRVELFCASLPIASALRKKFGGSTRRLPEDWEAQWFSAHRTKPLRVGKRLVVGGEAGSARDSTTLVIPAGAAFGTGEHATTAMSLRLLECVTRRWGMGWRMLDAGTGSGILALAGRRFGAGEVVAIDNDPLAIKTAKWNARENGIRGVSFRIADANKPIAGNFHLIAANLYSELLASVLPRFRRCLRLDGRLILSGVLREQESRLRGALRANGFRVQTARRRGKWVALLASRSPDQEKEWKKNTVDGHHRQKHLLRHP